MARIEVDIEDHLDEVKTIDLIDELVDRKDLCKLITKENLIKYLTDNLADEMKLEEFLEVFKNIPQAELTTFLKNYK